MSEIKYNKNDDSGIGNDRKKTILINWVDEKIINWEEEATAIINDVKMHVKEIEIAKELPSNDSNIYLNITTIENQQYCVHVSSVGFRVVATRYNCIDDDKRKISNIDENDIYETPYALLDIISPSYVESFGNQLCRQLLQLQQMRMQFNEEDEDAWDDTDEAKTCTACDDV